MKQLYTMVALAISAICFGQPFTETFDNLTLGPSYADGNFTGVQNIQWNYVHCRNEGSGTNDSFPITGNGIILRRISEPSSLSATFPNGLSEFSFQYRKAFTGNAARKLAIYVNGTLVGETSQYGSGSGEQDTVYTYHLPATAIQDITDPVTIKIQISSSGGNSQTTIDNIIWAPKVVATAPQLTASVTSLTDFVYTEGEGPSASQSFDLSGTDTNGTDVTVTAPAQFEVSADNTTFAATATLAAYNGDSTPIYVRLAAGAEVGTYNGNVTIAGAGTTTALEVQVSGEVEEVILPVLAASVTSLEDFVYTEGEGPSASQSFDLSGTDTNGTDVTVTAPAQFEVSTDNTTFAATATLAAYNGDSTPIYVRLAAGAEVGTYEGDLTISGNNSNEVTVSLSGDVTESASTKDHTIDGLSMYPNPATHQISIVSNAIGTKQVMIFDIVGKKVMETTTTETVNVSGLRSGMYLVKVTQDGKSATIKLVIK